MWNAEAWVDLLGPRKKWNEKVEERCHFAEENKHGVMFEAIVAVSVELGSNTPK